MIASLVQQCLVFTLLLQSCIMGLCSETHILRVSLRQSTLTNIVADAAIELIPRRKSTSCWTIPRASTPVRVRAACLHLPLQSHTPLQMWTLFQTYRCWGIALWRRDDHEHVVGSWASVVVVTPAHKTTFHLKKAPHSITTHTVPVLR